LQEGTPSFFCLAWRPPACPPTLVIDSSSLFLLFRLAPCEDLPFLTHLRHPGGSADDRNPYFDDCPPLHLLDLFTLLYGLAVTRVFPPPSPWPVPTRSLLVVHVPTPEFPACVLSVVSGVGRQSFSSLRAGWPSGPSESGSASRPFIPFCRRLSPRPGHAFRSYWRPRLCACGRTYSPEIRVIGSLHHRAAPQELDLKDLRRDVIFRPLPDPYPTTQLSFRLPAGSPVPV